MNQYNYVTLYPDCPPGMRITDVWLNWKWPETNTLINSGNRGKRRHTWTAAQLMKMRQMALDYKTYTEIALEMQCTTAAAEWAITKIIGMEKPNIKAKGARYAWENYWTDERKQFVRDNYITERKMTQEEIASSLGCGQKKVSEAIRDMEAGYL